MCEIQDELLPPSQMQDLRRAVAGSKTCTWVEFPYAGHMDAYELARSEYWPALSKFFNEIGLGAPHAFSAGQRQELDDSLEDDILDQVSASDNSDIGV